MADDYRSWLGIALLAVCSILVALAGTRFVVWIKCWVRVYKIRKNIIERLRRLSNEEEEILGTYIFEQGDVRCFDIRDSIVHSLVSAHILYQAATIGSHIGGIAFGITPFARKYLYEHRLEIFGIESLDDHGD